MPNIYPYNSKRNARHFEEKVGKKDPWTACIWRMFVCMSVVVTVWGSVGMFVV